jgi:hypothetical protein
MLAKRREMIRTAIITVACFNIISFEIPIGICSVLMVVEEDDEEGDI